MPTPNEPKTKACELCCKKPGENQPCISSFQWNEKPFDIPDLYAKPGSPCNDYNGYCDVFQNCREVDPSGPLATLRKLLLSDEGIESFKKWVVSNWYAVSLIIVGVFALLVSLNFSVISFTFRMSFHALTEIKLRRFFIFWSPGEDDKDIREFCK